MATPLVLAVKNGFFEAVDQPVPSFRATSAPPAVGRRNSDYQGVRVTSAAICGTKACVPMPRNMPVIVGSPTGQGPHGVAPTAKWNKPRATDFGCSSGSASTTVASPVSPQDISEDVHGMQACAPMPQKKLTTRASPIGKSPYQVAPSATLVGETEFGISSTGFSTAVANPMSQEDTFEATSSQKRTTAATSMSLIKKKSRHCKARRDRYRKLVESLMMAARTNPDTFNLDEVILPRAIREDEAEKAKLLATVYRLLARDAQVYQ